MTSHLSLKLWEKQYMEGNRTKFFITSFFVFRRGSSPATRRLNTLRFWRMTYGDSYSWFLPGQHTMLWSLMPSCSGTPATAAHNLLSALHWIRITVPDYVRKVTPLQELLKRCQGQAKSAKALNLSRISLVWMAEPNTAFRHVKELLADTVTLGHPNQHYEMCLFTDASDFHWGIILTRVPQKQLKVSVHDQKHEPLACLSGSFNATNVAGASLRRKHFQSWNR